MRNQGNFDKWQCITFQKTMKGNISISGEERKVEKEEKNPKQ